MEEEERRRDYRAGVAACAALAPWCEKGQAPAPSDYFPSLKAWAEEKEAERKPGTSWVEGQDMQNLLWNLWRPLADPPAAGAAAGAGEEADKEPDDGPQEAGEQAHE